MAHWMDTYGRIGDAGPVSKGTADAFKKAVSDAYKASHIPAAPKDWDDLSKMKPGKKGNSPTMDKAVHILNLEKAALQRAGITEPVLDFIIIQDWMESGAYSNSGYRLNNNPGNIQFGKHNTGGATKGTWSPTMGAYWARFSSLNNYALDKKRVMSLAPGYPIQATTLADFAHRLKLNNYYGDESEASYLAKLRSAGTTINTVAALYEDNHQTVADPTKKHLTWWQWGLIGVGGLIVVKAIVK